MPLHHLQVYDRSSPKALVWDVKARQRQFIAFDVDVKVGSMNKVHQHAVFQMGMPRAGFWFCWASIPLYGALGLKSYKGKASKWVYESNSSWRQQMANIGFRGFHIIQSRNSLESGQELTPRAKDPATDVLPEPVMTTLCLLQCLLRWGVAKPTHGGLRDPAGQAAALSLARGLLRSTVGQNTFTLPVYFDNSWESVWPKKPEVAPCLMLDIVGGDVQLEPWIALCSDGRKKLPCDWLREVQLCTGASPSSAALFDVLIRVAVESSCKGLFRQLLWTSALKIEIVLATAIKT